MARQKNNRPARPPVIQICTEGKTEAAYIAALCKELGICRRVQICSGGCGRKHTAIVQQAQQCMRDKNPSEVWLVYDMDEAANDETVFDNFCEAFQLAKEAGYHVAINVPCFEYWLLLHLQPCETDWPWDVCESRFKDKVNEIRKARKLPPYEKEQHKADPELFQLLGGQDGVDNARKCIERLAEQCGYKLSELCSLSEDQARKLFRNKARPCTSMPVLIDRLIELSKQ